jgi:hypothetical protein
MNLARPPQPKQLLVGKKFSWLNRNHHATKNRKVIPSICFFHVLVFQSTRFSVNVNGWHIQSDNAAAIAEEGGGDDVLGQG